MMKIFLSLMLPAFLFGQEGKLVLNIDRAVELALEKNSSIKIARLDVEKAEEKVKETYSGYYPQLDASGQYQRYINKPVIFLPPGSPFGATLEIGSDNSYAGALSLGMPLFSLALIRGSGLADAGVEMSRVNLHSARVKLVGDVQKAYLSVLLAGEYAQVLQQSLKNAGDNLERVRNLNKRGLLSNYDLLRAEVQVENLKPGVIQAENNYRLAADGLKVTIGLDASTEIEVSGELKYEEGKAAPKIDEIMDEVNKNNPQLLLLHKQIELSEKTVELERTAYIPSLAAFGNYQYQTQANDFEFSNYKWVKTFLVGLQLQVPIFHGFKTQAKVEQSKITLSQANEQKSGFLKAVRTQAQSIIYRIEQAILRIETQSKTVKQAAEGYNIAKSRLENGLATQLEVNDAELALRQARLNRLQAVYDLNTAESDLGALTGRIVNVK